MMASESVEYKTLIKCIDKLTIAFKSSPVSIANELLANGFISSEAHGNMLSTPGLGEDVKATRLVTCVTDMVKMCPGKYYEFMSLPLFKEQWLCPIHELITNEYEMLKKAVLCKKDLPTDQPDAPIDGNTDKLSPSIDEKVVTEDKINSDDETYEVFRCPCGQCSLESYIDDGCPKSNSDSFPYLDISKLDEDDKEDLTQQLSKDTTAMIKRFANLLDETSTSLAARGVSVQRLALRALSLGAYESEEILKPLLSEDERRLMNSSSIDEAFLVLRPHMSFFNFELLKHIIDCNGLCSDSDREHMDEYVSKFDIFCKRKVFEISPGAVGQTTSTLKKHKRKAFAVLMTKHEAEPNLVFVNAAKQKIANLLKLKPSTLHLHRIDEGSILLVFSVPTFVAKKLFPLKPSTVAKLKDEGFLVLAPPATEESYKDKSMKKRMSLPLKSKEKEVKVFKTFSLDSLCVKDDSRTAFLLLCSASNGHTETIQALIGAETNDILYSLWNGKSALMLATQGGHTETVKALLHAGADAPALLHLRWKGNTALMMSAKGGHTTTVKVLIEAGIDVAIRNNYGNTALMLAAQGGHTEAVKALIEVGGNATLTNVHEMTSLMLAAQGGHTETIKALITAGANVTSRNKNEETALMLAAQGGHTGTVKALIKAGADVNLKGHRLAYWSINYEETALMLAAQGGHTETVKALIDACADVNLTNRLEETALMLAAKGGHTGTVKTLIEGGADVNLKGHRLAYWSVNYEETALMLAAQGGHTETVEALIKAGADVNQNNIDKTTPLMLAAQGGHTEAVKALIEAGADVNVKNRFGKTAVMLAAQVEYTETIETLIATGASRVDVTFMQLERFFADLEEVSILDPRGTGFIGRSGHEPQTNLQGSLPWSKSEPQTPDASATRQEARRTCSLISMEASSLEAEARHTYSSLPNLEASSP